MLEARAHSGAVRQVRYPVKWGVIPSPYLPSPGVAYTASKHALRGITLNTAASYGSKGIRCNIIMPGAMNTNIGDSFKAGIHQEGFENMQKSRAVYSPMVDTNGIGKTVTYLISDFAEAINGACITADGGWSAF